MKSKGHVAPTSIQPPTGREQAEMNGHLNGVNGHAKIKLEEKLDESQLDRLATGVTVDTSNPEVHSSICYISCMHSRLNCSLL